MSSFIDADAILEEYKQKDLLRSRQILKQTKDNIVTIDNKKYINFSSNDYLGLAQDKSLKKWFKESIDEHGTSSSSSPLISGYTNVHRELEKKVASFFQRDDAIIFSSGYLANLAIASTFIDKSTNVFQDKLCHASLIDAARLSAGKHIRYKHNDCSHLQLVLEKNRSTNQILMTDGLFSMDGDIANVKEIAELCQRYNCLLFVDDAHGIGAIGKSGGGVLQLESITQKKAPLLSGTFGKAFGMSGAFITGEHKLIELMVQKARTYIYSTSIPAATAATLIKVIDLVSSAHEKRESLNKNIQYFSENITVDTKSSSQIQPVIMGSAKSAIDLSNSLFEEGFLAMCIRPPTVPKDTSRIRVSLSATHTQDQVNKLIRALNMEISNG